MYPGSDAGLGAKGQMAKCPHGQMAKPPNGQSVLMPKRTPVLLSSRPISDDDPARPCR